MQAGDVFVVARRPTRWRPSTRSRAFALHAWRNTRRFREESPATPTTSRTWCRSWWHRVRASLDGPSGASTFSERSGSSSSASGAARAGSATSSRRCACARRSAGALGHAAEVCATRRGSRLPDDGAVRGPRATPPSRGDRCRNRHRGGRTGLERPGVAAPIAFLAGAVAMVATGCVAIGRAYREIDVRIYVMIAGVIPLGLAMEEPAPRRSSPTTYKASPTDGVRVAY